MSTTMRSKESQNHMSHFLHRFSSSQKMDMGSCTYLFEGICLVEIESFRCHIKCHVHFFARVAMQTVCEDVRGNDKNVMLPSKFCEKVCGTLTMFYLKCMSYM